MSEIKIDNRVEQIKDCVKRLGGLSEDRANDEKRARTEKELLPLLEEELDRLYLTSDEIGVYPVGDTFLKDKEGNPLNPRKKGGKRQVYFLGSGKAIKLENQDRFNGSLYVGNTSTELAQIIMDPKVQNDIPKIYGWGVLGNRDFLLVERVSPLERIVKINILEEIDYEKEWFGRDYDGYGHSYTVTESCRPYIEQVKALQERWGDTLVDFKTENLGLADDGRIVVLDIGTLTAESSKKKLPFGFIGVMNTAAERVKVKRAVKKG